MEIGFYFYTILVMLVCITAGTISLSAYFVSRKRSHLAVVAFFLFYFLDLALIFQNEYLGQNTDFPLDAFYGIDHPALKTLFSLGTIESLWLIVCDYLDERRRPLLVGPAVAFVLASAGIVIFLPEGPWRQYLFYSMRQVFLLWCLGYALFRYRTAPTPIEKARLRRQRPLFAVTLALTLCIVAEDTFMMLVWTPDPSQTTMLPLYISERNFSENFLMLAFAFFSLREAAGTLRMRFKEPPTSENPTVRQHIDDLLPAYSARHGLTAREREPRTCAGGQGQPEHRERPHAGAWHREGARPQHPEENRPGKPSGAHTGLLEGIARPLSRPRPCHATTPPRFAPPRALPAPLAAQSERQNANGDSERREEL